LRRFTRVPNIRDVPIAKINPSNAEQELTDAMVNVIDGLESQTEGPVLLSELPDGSYSIEDGFHRVADSILKGRKTIRADVLSSRTKYMRKPDTSIGRMR